MTNVNIDMNNCQNLSIIYKDRELNLDLEKISYYKTLNHLNLKDVNNELEEYSSNLDLIVCETNVDLSTLGLLYDSYNEKDNKMVCITMGLVFYIFLMTISYFLSVYVVERIPDTLPIRNHCGQLRAKTKKSVQRTNQLHIRPVQEQRFKHLSVCQF